MTTLYLVIEDEDGTHVKEWGLNNYSEEDQAVFDDARMVLDTWYSSTGIDAWEVE